VTSNAPIEGGTETLTIDQIPTGTVTVEATAFNGPDGTGTALAKGSQEVSVHSNASTATTVILFDVLGTVSLSFNYVPVDPVEIPNYRQNKPYFSR
jgi:hypothetical protein